ncbi:MAG: MFS transporter [Leptolyngbya sp.]|nr:MFS transporter [Candidatus Melainabacteria bacterium]
MPKISMKELMGLPTKFREEFRQTFRSLSNPYLRLYSIGQLVSNAGTWMQSMALSWLVYKLTDSAVALGIVSFASYVPLLFLTYFGGILADRFDRRKILMATQLCGMLQALVLTVLVATGNLSVPAVIGCALFLGCVTAIEVPTRQAFLSDLVAKKDLTNAISVNSAIFNIARLSGPLLAGVLIAIFGEVICFGINTVSYVFAVYTLSQVAKAVVVGAKPKTDSAANSDKLKATLRDPRIRGLLGLAIVTSMFGFQYGVLLPVIVDKMLLGSAAQLSILSASGGIGALAGALLLARQNRGTALLKGIGIAALSLGFFIAIIASSHSVALSAVAAACAGLCVSIQFSGGNSLLQQLVPTEIKGRMMGIFSMCQLGFTPFAGLMAGWTAEHYGVSNALLIAASVCAISGVVYLVRLRSQSRSDGGSNTDESSA